MAKAINYFADIQVHVIEEMCHKYIFQKLGNLQLLHVYIVFEFYRMHIATAQLVICWCKNWASA